MHALAICMHQRGDQVSGSDDEIYEPSRTQLAQHDLLPAKMGWNPDRINKKIDQVILGMHAKADNPELKRAIELGIPVKSFPEFVSEAVQDKIKIVVAGSHGKTTVTSMIMHVLQKNGFGFDYLVGARLDGFDNMVQISDAPIIVIEGDEYLSSAIDRRPKILHYDPDVTIMTGIEWDHMNVFPTEENYVGQFEKYLTGLRPEAKVIYFERDPAIRKILAQLTSRCRIIPYLEHPYLQNEGNVYLLGRKECTQVEVFGKHNMQNITAAYLACCTLNITDRQFYGAMESFSGAHKRLQFLLKKEDRIAYFDFAHAPSKARATVAAVREKYPEKQLIACLELHTFSSLNKEFLHQYAGTLDAADEAIVYFSDHTLEMKGLPPLSEKDVQVNFQNENISVIKDNVTLKRTLDKCLSDNCVLLLMSSGTFHGLDLKMLAEELFSK